MTHILVTRATPTSAWRLLGERAPDDPWPPLHAGPAEFMLVDLEAVAGTTAVVSAEDAAAQAVTACVEDLRRRLALPALDDAAAAKVADDLVAAASTDKLTPSA